MELLRPEPQRKLHKSVHITNYYHKNSGGISTAYNRLLDAANRHKRYVRLIVPGMRDEIEEVSEYGRIYYVKANFSPVFDKRYRVMQAWNSYIFDKTRIRQILRKEKPDMIEIGEKYSLSLLAGLIRKGYFKSLGRLMLVHFIEATISVPFKGFTISDRNLVDRRLRSSGNTTQYRNRLQVEHPFTVKSTEFKAFIADEVFYDSVERAWIRNRFSIGVSRKFSERYTGEIYYLRQNDGFSRPGDLNVIGTTLRVRLK